VDARTTASEASEDHSDAERSSAARRYAPLEAGACGAGDAEGYVSLLREVDTTRSRERVEESRGARERE